MNLGIDIIEIRRIEKLIKNRRFLERIFTENEISHINKKELEIDKAITASGLFSAKEAVSKSFGTGISGFKWKDIEILHDSKGKPYTNLHGYAEELLGSRNIEITISHSRETAVAQAIIFDEKKCDYKKRLVARSLPPIEMPKRSPDTHKGNYGKLAVIGGSKGMIGAPCLTSFAALKTGSGLVYTVVPESIYEIIAIKSLENIVISIDDSDKGYFDNSSYELFCRENKGNNRFDTIAIGPGMGTCRASLDFIKSVVNMGLPTVIDADGLNLISMDKSILDLNERLILTPHTAEFSRLTGVEIEEIERDREYHAKNFSEKYGLTLVLKGNNTIVASRGKVYINYTGNPGMATAGSGDVLTGIISSLLGQGLDDYDSARMGVYLHGLAGDIASGVLGEYSITAGDILKKLPFAIKASVKGE